MERKMSLIDKHMKSYLNQEVILVQVDGSAFKGKLMEYDEKYVVLEEVIQTSTKQRNWFTVTVAVPSKSMENNDKLIGGSIIGDTESEVLELKTAIIALEHIMRIWLWRPKTQAIGSEFRA